MHLWQLTIAHDKLKVIFQSTDIKSDNDKKTLPGSNKDAAFYSGKIHSAQYFITKILSCVEAKINSKINEEFDAIVIDEISFGEEMPR